MDPSYLDSRVVEFFKMFESKSHELADRDFTHGGSYNAYTCSETTNFYFDINVDNFEEALDRFAQFFIKPLMSQDAVLREIKAVDSVSLQKHLASKDHPYHKFSTGSWETLETKPKERGLDIRLELLKLYDSYSGNLMHLVVYGKALTAFTAQLSAYSDVKNTDQRSFKCPSHPLSEEHLQLLVSMRLTDAGHEHMEDNVGLIIKYLLLLKEDGVHEWIFNEIVAINETEFHYQDKVHPISYVTDTVSSMRKKVGP
ncbi:hypothetical protein ACP4OV_019135 [Aristida adscensionis]